MADNTPVTIDIKCGCGKKLGKQTLPTVSNPRVHGNKAACQPCGERRVVAILAARSKK